jgi:diadenosine tetraphosphatase ApaH/serine/threonine PP2A family protein phosphatase
VRYLIVSDIHANLDALEAVLDAAPAGDAWDRVVVLGDLVGYGADPNGVVDRVRTLEPLAVIRGNHDKAACGVDDGSSFNTVARIAAQWTFETLTPANREYLRALPMGPVSIDEGLEICHGAPFDEDHYIFDADDATRAMAAASRPLCLFGHTHLPAVYQHEHGRLTAAYAPDADEDERLEVRGGVRYLVNPGSVGQPRDGDPRAAFGLYDTEGPTLLLRRIPYPVGSAQRRILDAGLPASLANRLAIGR